MSNYDSDSELLVPNDQTLSIWNTWTNRAILKSLAGVFLGVSVLMFYLTLNSSYAPFSGIGLFSFCIGLFLWAVFYQMEMAYRKVTPNRIR